MYFETESESLANIGLTPPQTLFRRLHFPSYKMTVIKKKKGDVHPLNFLLNAAYSSLRISVQATIAAFKLYLALVQLRYFKTRGPQWQDGFLFGP